MRLDPFRFEGAHAVLTGAASGIGEQLAYQLAGKGTLLVLADRDGPRLRSVADRIRREHPALQVCEIVVDLALPADVASLVAQVRTLWPTLELLVNNAGVALGGAFVDLTAEEFDWVLAVNFSAPIALCRGLLPALRRSPGSHIVNVSSLFGLVAPPGQTAYASSKFALRGFSEALRAELAPLRIGVTCVHPGGIRTRIAETARVAAAVPDDEAQAGKAAFAKLLRFPADKAAARILDGIEHRKGRVLIAFSARAGDLLARLLPSGHVALMARLQPETSRRALARLTASDDE